MTVKIRLMSPDPAELDQVETAIRGVLEVPAPADDYRSRRAGDPTRRRYLETTGVRATSTSEQQHQDQAAARDQLSPLMAGDDAKRRRDLADEIGILTATDRQLKAQPWYPIQPGDVVLCYLPFPGHDPDHHAATYVAVEDPDGIPGIDECARLRKVSETRQPWHDTDPVDQVDEPEYVLWYDSDAHRWTLSAQLGNGLEPWRHADSITDPDALDAAQQWAAGHITEFSPDDLVTGWQPTPDTSPLQGHIPTTGDQDQAPTGEPRELLADFYEMWFEAGPASLTVIRAGAVVHGRPVTATVPRTAVRAGRA